MHGPSMGRDIAQGFTLLILLGIGGGVLIGMGVAYLFF